MSPDLSRKGELLKEAWMYLDTFLKDDKYPPKTGVCTLLVRRFRMRRLPSGRVVVDAKSDAWEFPDEAAMAAEIVARGMVELPPEANGDPRFIPEEFDPECLEIT